MHTYEKCLTCFERQAADACSISNLTAPQTNKVLNAVKKQINLFDCTKSPVEMAVKIHALVRSESGISDPYLKLKNEINQLANLNIARFKQMIDNASDKFAASVKLAIAGNILDFGVYSAASQSNETLLQTANQALNEPLAGNSLTEFQDEINHAKKIIYMGDNVGECFFDNLLLDFLPLDKIKYGVRGAPILNDATRPDAEAAGIHKRCDVIDTGDCAPGVLLERCSKSFINEFEQADLIIAKGQGNYESLSNVDKKCIFLTKVKCEVISRDTGYPEGSALLKINKGGNIH
jgi:damage-control phosphatase, subfamily I